MSALVERLASIAGAVETLDLPSGPELPMVAPADDATCLELVHMAAQDGLALLPLGAGSKLSWCQPPTHADFALTTRALDGVLSYEPGDGTVSARAGTPMNTLAESVGAGGHHLTPELPEAAGATLGGCVAAGQSGFDRARFGPLRNHLLGTRVLLADGTRPKSGGQLVKNVTGYDLHKLYCGSHGSLCLILEASLRLFPRPAEERVFLLECVELAQALELAARVLATDARPLALLVHDLGEGARWEFALVLAGNAARVAWERERVLAILPELVEHAGEAAARERARLRELERWDQRWPNYVLETPPANLAATSAELRTSWKRASSRPRSLWQPGLARIACWLTSEDGDWLMPAPRAGAASARIQRWLELPARLEGQVDRFGAPSSGLPRMRKLRDALDPAGVFARGRFHGGL